jgi:hypothetical protein
VSSDNGSYISDSLSWYEEANAQLTNMRNTSVEELDPQTTQREHRHEYKNDFAGEYFSISDGGTNSCLELDGAYWSHRSTRSTSLALIATLWRQSVVALS